MIKETTIEKNHPQCAKMLEDAVFNKEQIIQIEFLINSRPRKCLGFKTPLEVAASSVALRG